MDARLGRFLSVDPIAPSYPMLTPYQFASNIPIAAVDLDGFEAKLSIACVTNRTDGDHRKDDATFKFRAEQMKVCNPSFEVHVTHTGKEFVDMLVNATTVEGSISRIAIFSHGTSFQLVMNENKGLVVNSDMKYNGAGEATLDDITNEISTGKIKFEDNAIVFSQACNNGTEFGAEFTLKTGVSFIGATDQVTPEKTADGKSETGQFKTEGTFLKFERIVVGTETVSVKDPNTGKMVDKEQNVYGLKTTDLGQTVDPSALLKDEPSDGNSNDKK